MHLSMFIAWLQDHLLNLVPFLYLFLLLVMVLVSRCLSWFSVDVNPRPQYLHCADFKSHLCATKPCHCFKRIHPKAPVLSHQVDFCHFQNLQHSINSILRHIRNIATSCTLLPCQSCATSHQVTQCGTCCPSPPNSACPQSSHLPFCLNEFGKHVRNS